MAVVKCYAELDGKPFDIPRREGSPFTRLEEIEEVMLLLAEFYKNQFSDEHEIWLTWDESKFIKGQPHVIPFSQTIHVADLISAYVNYTRPQSQG